MANVEKIVNQICNFVAYVDSFYNEKTGIYPIKGMTNSWLLKLFKNISVLWVKIFVAIVSIENG